MKDNSGHRHFDRQLRISWVLLAVGVRSGTLTIYVLGGYWQRPDWVEAVCKRDPLMLLGLGMATRLEHSASFERSSGRRLGPHRLQERPDAEDFDHSFQVVGQNVKAHLRFDLF
jgi:hypothetical protein